jgi:hypothetical protein
LPALDAGPAESVAQPGSNAPAPSAARPARNSRRGDTWCRSAKARGEPFECFITLSSFVLFEPFFDAAQEYRMR